MKNTILVCAVDEENELYSFSNNYKKNTIKAPGVNLDISAVNFKNEVVYTKISGYANAIVSRIIGSLLVDSLNIDNLLTNNLYTSEYLNCNLFI